MTHQSGHQWPEPYEPKPAAVDASRPVRGFIRHRLVVPLLTQRKFGMCLALIGPPTIALLFYALSPAIYRAQTNVIVTTNLEHQAKNARDVIENNLLLPSRELVNAEADLLANPVVIEQTLAQFGVAELYPNFLKSQADSQMAWDAAVRQFQSAIRVVPIQQSGIIRLTFEHTNARIAVKALNQFVLCYQMSRAKILEGRNSRTTAATIARRVKDLEQLEQARGEMRTMIGTPDLTQQREILIRNRNDNEEGLRRTVERIQSLSVRLANLAQIRSRVVVDNPSSQADSRARASHTRNVTAEQNPVRAAPVQSKGQLVVVQDQAAGADTVTVKLLPGQSPVQLAQRLLNQFMTRKQGLPLKVAAGAGLATHEARIAQALRDLDSLEQEHAEPKQALNVTAAGRARVAQHTNMSEQPQQPESAAASSDTQTIILAQSSKAFSSGRVSAVTRIDPVTIATSELQADLLWPQLGILSGDNQTDPLLQRLQHRPFAIQQQVNDTRIIPAKLPVAPLPVATAIDQDRVSAQTELNALKAQQIIDVVSIGLIDQQLVRLGQADLRLNLMNARIADQHERVTAAQKLYNTAKAAEDEDQDSIRDIVQTSSEAISVSSVAPGASALGAAFASLFLAATIFLIARISGRRLTARNRPLELFLNPPRPETG